MDAGYEHAAVRYRASSEADVEQLGLHVDRLVEHFGGLQKLLAATIEDLLAVEGVGESRARGVREGLSRLAESSILERYV